VVRFFVFCNDIDGHFYTFCRHYSIVDEEYRILVREYLSKEVVLLEVS
jgi:hypothetical protein